MKYFNISLASILISLFILFTLASSVSISSLQAQTSFTGENYAVVPKNFTFDRDLTTDIQGQDVQFLQCILNVKPVTAVFGPITKQAVVNFQNAHLDQILKPAGLTQGTGYVGPSTRAYLNEQVSQRGATNYEGGCELTNKNNNNNPTGNNQGGNRNNNSGSNPSGNNQNPSTNPNSAAQNNDWLIAYLLLSGRSSNNVSGLNNNPSGSGGNTGFSSGAGGTSGGAQGGSGTSLYGNGQGVFRSPGDDTSTNPPELPTIPTSNSDGSSFGLISGSYDPYNSTNNPLLGQNPPPGSGLGDLSLEDPQCTYSWQQFDRNTGLPCPSTNRNVNLTSNSSDPTFFGGKSLYYSKDDKNKLLPTGVGEKNHQLVQVSNVYDRPCNCSNTYLYENDNSRKPGSTGPIYMVISNIFSDIKPAGFEPHAPPHIPATCTTGNFSTVFGTPTPQSDEALRRQGAPIDDQFCQTWQKDQHMSQSYSDPYYICKPDPIYSSPNFKGMVVKMEGATIAACPSGR